MEKRKTFNGIIAAGMAAICTFIAGCISYAIGVLNDSQVWEILGATLTVGSLLAMLTGFAAALVTKQWKKAIIVCCSCVVSLIIGLFFAIGIGAGQHHPPKQAEPEAPILTWNAVMDDTTHIKVLPTRLEKGSKWTDGEYFYTVTTTGSTILLEGMTLHEGGMDMTLKEIDGELFVSWKDNDLATFGYDGNKVAHLELAREGSGEHFELLMICDDEGAPTQVLQRYSGDELAFAKGQLYAALDGVYNESDSGKQQWTFFANGTLSVNHDMSTGDAPEAKAYDFEKIYHTPSNVIRLADGKRYSITRDEQELVITKPVYDDVEEYWQSSNDTIMVLERAEPNAVWYKERIFTPNMTTVLSCNTLSVLLPENYDDPSPIAILNRYLIEHFIERMNNQANETDENEEEDVE